MLRVALVGYGYWGSKLARNIHGNPNAKLAAVVDKSPHQLDQASWDYEETSLSVYSDIKDIFGTSIEAVVIATDIDSHGSLVHEALSNNLHVFVEKPLTTNIEQAGELIQLAKERKKVLAVDHTLLYSDVTSVLRARMKQNTTDQDSGKLFNPKARIVINRLNIVPPTVVSAVWDLGPHDVALLDYLTNGVLPTAVSAIGNHRDVCMELTYANGSSAIITLGLGGPVRSRLFSFFSPSKDLSFQYDWLTNTFSDRDSVIIQPNDKPVFEPGREPLYNAVNDFVQSAINGESKPIANDEHAYRVVQVLSTADYCIREKKQGISPVIV